MLDNYRRKPAPAMNLGLGAARGSVVIRVDGHATLAPDYLRRAVDALEATGADCVGGVLQSEGDTFTGRAIALAMSSHFGVGGAAFRSGGAGETDTVAFGAYRRDVFDRIGGFVEDIDRGEDDEFNSRLRDSGGSIVLVPELRATYTVRGDLRALARQYFGYGRAKPAVLYLHPRQVRPRQMAPAAFVVALLGSGVLAITGKSGAIKILATVYTLAATIVSFSLAQRHDMRIYPALMSAFACLHVSYGMGFLAGWVGLAGRILTRTARRSGAHQSMEAPQTPRD
jgi:hypothetical protein